jgi:hypothetical protein
LKSHTIQQYVYMYICHTAIPHCLPHLREIYIDLPCPFSCQYAHLSLYQYCIMISLRYRRYGYSHTISEEPKAKDTF